MMLRAIHVLGAVAILATGAVHLQQYIVENFRTIPTVHVLFLLNVIGSGVVGLFLLAPLERVLPGRWADAAVALLATVGLTIAIGSLVALFVSESGTLFGLRTSGYSTPAVLAIVAEGAAVLLLTPVIVATAGRASRGAPESSAGRDRHAAPVV